MADQDSKRMSFWGIGPSVEGPAAVYAALAGAATYRWPEWFAITGIPYRTLFVVASLLLVIGIPFQLIAGRLLLQAYDEDRLITTGVYAICRNPLYANIMLTLFPALALLCCSWLMLTTSVVTYILVRWRLHHEEEYLQARYGQEYVDYRHRTNAVFPTIRCWRDRSCKVKR